MELERPEGVTSGLVSLAPAPAMDSLEHHEPFFRVQQLLNTVHDYVNERLVHVNYISLIIVSPSSGDEIAGRQATMPSCLCWLGGSPRQDNWQVCHLQAQSSLQLSDLSHTSSKPYTDPRWVFML